MSPIDSNLIDPVSPRDLDPNALAAVVADPTLPLVERHRAMDQLTALVQSLARVALAGYDTRLPVEEMIGSAPGLIWERLQRHYPATPSAFEPWCHTVLTHWAVDLCRRNRRDPLRDAFLVQDWDPARPPVEDDGADELADRAGKLRDALDRFRDGPCVRRDVDHYAVFLVHLRLKLAAMASDVYLDGRARAGQPPTLAADSASELILWHESDGRRRFRPGWPELSSIWARVRSSLQQPPHRVDGKTFTHLMRDLLVADGRLSSDTWYQWVLRARALAESHIPPAAWRDFFARWLPARRGRASTE